MKITEVQKTLFEAQKRYPFAGIIPAAIQVIVSLGELLAAAASICRNPARTASFFQEGIYYLGISAANLISFGCGLPLYCFIKTHCCKPEESDLTFGPPPPDPFSLSTPSNPMTDKQLLDLL